MAENQELKRAETGSGGRQHFERIAELREKHADELAAIRAKLTNGEEEDDVVVYRFLRGYRFDVDAAAAALDRTLAFRAEYHTAELRERSKGLRQEEMPHADVFARCFPHTIDHGVDNKGQPLSMLRIGRTNPAMLCKLISLEDLVEYHLSHVENRAEYVARLSHEKGVVMRVCRILDLDGLSAKALHRQGISYMRHIIKLGQDNYPEMLGNLYIINAPWIFRTFWAIVKPLLTEGTIERIQILGDDYHKVLAENIPLEHLPPMWGGECSSCPNGCIVERHPDEGMTKLAVAARAVEEVDVEIEEEGAMVSWEFRTTKKDIGFRVFFLPKGGDERELVVDDGRVDSHEFTHSGGFEAPGPGKVTLQFDNSGSRWTAKSVVYDVEHQSGVDVEGEE